MALEVFLPRLTHDMRNGILVRWLKAEGEPVQAGEPLYEVETDKAVTEVAAEGSGVLHQLDYKDGDEIPIGTVIAYLLADGEVFAPSDTRMPGPLAQRGGIVATPIARRIAREKGVDLSQLAGTGPQGRIVEADVLAYLSRANQRAGESANQRISESASRRISESASQRAGESERQRASESANQRVGESERQRASKSGSLNAGTERVPLTRAQILTGQRMALSNQSIPQFVLEVDVDMTEAQRLRQRMNWTPGHTAILVKVVAEALQRHPRVNASLDGEFVRIHPEINVGLATATPEGLLVPVIGEANTLRLRQIQDAIDEIRDQAGRGKIGSAYLRESTFTLSNLGMYGIDRFEALVNPPEAAILAAGRIREMPWVSAGEIQVRPILTLRLSADHRVLDGASAAPFLVEVKNSLENPYEML